MVDAPGPREPASDLGTGLLVAMWRHRLVVISSAIVGAIVATVAVIAVPERYEATAELVVKDARDTAVYRDLGPRDSARGVRNHVEALTADETISRAAQAAGISGQPSTLRRSVEVDIVDTDIVSISASADDPERAAAFANALANEFTLGLRAEVQTYADAARQELFALRDQLQATIVATEATLESTTDEVTRATLERRRFLALEDLQRAELTAEEFRIDAALYGDGLSRFSEATPPSRSQDPGPLYAALLGALVGLSFGSLLAWYQSERNPRLVHASDAEPLLGMRLLGSLGPTWRRGSALQASADARDVIGALSFGLQDARVIMLSGADRGRVTADASVQVAVAAAAEGLKVALIDGNPEDPVEPLLTGRRTAARAIDVTTPGGDLMAAMYPAHSSSGPPIEVLGLSSLPPTSLRTVFGSTEFHRVLSKLVDDGYQVLLHAPPMSAGTNAALLAGLAEGIVVTVQRGASAWTVLECRRRIEASRAPGLGYVFSVVAPEQGGLRRFLPGRLPSIRGLRASAP